MSYFAKSLLIFGLITLPALAERQAYSDGSYDETVQIGPGETRVSHYVPVSGAGYRVQLVTQKRYALNSVGQSVLAMQTYWSDSNGDGYAEIDNYVLYYDDGSFALGTQKGADTSGATYTQFSDVEPRRFSAAYNQRPAWAQAYEKDPRNTVRVYSNGFCYVNADGSCTLETACDKGVQNANMRTALAILQKARVDFQDPETLAVKHAKLRYDREAMILAACPR